MLDHDVADGKDWPVPEGPLSKTCLLALAAASLFQKELRADAAFVLLDATSIRWRHNRLFRMAARYVQVNWWGWPSPR